MVSYASVARLMTKLGILIGSGLFVFSQLPILFGIKTRIITNITDIPDRLFPLQSVYLHDISTPYIYYLTLGCQILSVTIADLVFITNDLAFGVFIMHANGQFEILSNKIQDSIKNRPHKFQESLKNQVNDHCRLIRYL